MTGDYKIRDDILATMFTTLRLQSECGPDSAGNEGLVFLAGRSGGTVTTYSEVITPHVNNSYGHVFVDAGEFGRCAKQARAQGLQLLAQVHSHPGTCCHHSDGDDKLIILPFDGMLSIVVPNYARDAVPLSACGVHQHHGGVWYWCTEKSIHRRLKITSNL